MAGRTGRNYGGGDTEKDREKALALIQEQPPRLPMPKGDMARELGMNAPLWKLLTDTVYPSAKSVDGILQAVGYCQQRNLDVMKRPVHVVPMWNSALNREVETVWPGIGEQRTTAARTGQWAGTDDVVFGPTKNEAFADKQTRGGNTKYVVEDSCDAFEFPLWAQFTVYKMVGGQRVAFVGPKVLFKETYSGSKGLAVPNSMWRKRPFGQLEKCAEAAALRRAFPEELGEQYVAEEMEGKTFMGHNGGPKLDDEVPEAETVKSNAAPTRESSAAADEKRAADETFAGNTRNGLATCTLEQLERAWEVDKARIESLDEDLRIVVEDLYADARKRLGADAPLSDEDIAAYKTEFRRDLKTRETVEQVVALVAREAENLDALPEADQAELDFEIDEYRDSIAALASATDDGAPSAADTSTGPKEA